MSDKAFNNMKLFYNKYKEKHPVSPLVINKSNPSTAIYMMMNYKHKEILDLNPLNFKYFISYIFSSVMLTEMLFQTFDLDIKNMLFLKSTRLAYQMNKYNDESLIPAYHRKSVVYKLLKEKDIENIKLQIIQNIDIPIIYIIENNTYIRLEDVLNKTQSNIEFDPKQRYYIKENLKYSYNTYIKLTIDEILKYFKYRIITDLHLSLHSIKNSKYNQLKSLKCDINNFNNIQCKINEILHLLPEHYYHEKLSNKDYSKCVIEYIRICRFFNIEGYFKMGEDIFNMQQQIYEIFNLYRYFLIGGGTGIGKTAIIPLLYLYFITFDKIVDQTLTTDVDYFKEFRILICEPRISTTTNPYLFLRYNTGLDYKFTCDLERENYLDTKTSYKKEFYKDHSLIKMKYQDYKNQNEEDYLIKFITDGTLLNELLNNINDKSTSYTINHKLIVIDEVHENSINTIMTMSILSMLIDEDDLLPYNKRQLTHFKIMLITAMCQPKEKEIFHQLFPGLYDIDNLPNKTKYNVEEIYDTSQKYYKYIKQTQNGLIFISTSAKIDSYYDTLTKLYPNLSILKLTRDTNKKLYNGSIENYIELYVFKYHKNYLIIATNIAESSITFPKLDYVIDFGEQFNIKYNVKTKLKQFINEPMTKNSWVQRIGRIGRKQNGTYYGLYNKSSLIEYNNKILTENIYYILLKIIYKLKNTKRTFTVLHKLKTIFNAQEIIETYEQDFTHLNWVIDHTITNELQQLFTLRSVLIKYLKLDEYISFILSNLLYYNYTKEIKLFVLFNFKINNVSIINKLLNSKEYKDYIIKNNNYNSDILLCLSFLKTLNNTEHIKIITTYIKHVNTNNNTPVALAPNIYLDELLDFSQLVYKTADIDNAIKHACYFSKTNVQTLFENSIVKSFKLAYALELEPKFELLHKIM